jgi:hypothetical protein
MKTKSVLSMGKHPRGKSFLMMLSLTEHEYLIRRALETGISAAALIRSNMFRSGWRETLEALRVSQGRTPLAVLDARHKGV